MGRTKEQEKARSAKPKTGVARRLRYRARMYAILAVRGPYASRLGRKLRKLAREGKLTP